MENKIVWPGILLVCFVAITILTIFPSKHKQCIDRNRIVIEKLKEKNADRETIKNKGYEIGINCRADTNFNLIE